MKKLGCILFAVMILFSFVCITACSNSRIDKEDEIRTMSNYMTRGMNTLSGDWIYGLALDKEKNPIFAKEKLDGSEYAPINTSSYAYQITVLDGWIYYITYNQSTKVNQIEKTSTSGSDSSIIIKAATDHEIGYLFIYKNELYYNDLVVTDETSEGKLYKCGLDGSNTQVVLEKPVYVPYIVNGKLYYEDDADFSTLHVCDLDGKNDKRISDDVVLSYVMNGEYIYYSTFNGEVSFNANNRITDETFDTVNYCICRMKMDGSEKEIVINANADYFGMNATTIYYIDNADECKLYSYDIATKSVKSISQDRYISNINISENRLGYFVYTDDYFSSASAAIDKNVYCDLDGQNTKSLFIED